MKKFFTLFTYCVFGFLTSRTQIAPDTLLQKKDTTSKLIIHDSVIAVAAIDSIATAQADSLAMEDAQARKEKIEAFQQVLSKHSYLPFLKPPVESNLYLNRDTGHEWLFYFLVGLLFYFACIRFFFGKYLANMMTLFFRASMRQQQIREQLLQTPLPSLLLNILFVISAGLYLTLLSRYYGITFFSGFWITLLYTIIFVAVIYLGKYIVLKIIGWIFNVSSATDMYIFIVFLVNKLLGIILLPFVILISFPNSNLLPVLIPLSYVMLILLFSYRFLSSFRPIRNEIKVNRFHFFLYLCAFEIAPLLLIYKVLLVFVERSY